MVVTVAVPMITVLCLAWRAVTRFLVVSGVEARAFVDNGNGVKPAPGVPLAARAGSFGSCAEALSQLEDMPAAVALVIIKGHL